MATITRENEQLLYIRFGGRSVDLPVAELDLTAASDDRQIKNRVAEYLEVTPRQLEWHVIDRYPNGNLTIRPEALFG
jgi:hypothetical protein